MEETRYEIGDRVRLIDTIPKGQGLPDGWVEEMLQYLGRTVTISSIDSDDTFLIEEDREGWYFRLTDIVQKEEKEYSIF